MRVNTPVRAGVYTEYTNLLHDMGAAIITDTFELTQLYQWHLRITTNKTRGTLQTVHRVGCSNHRNWLFL